MSTLILQSNKNRRHYSDKPELIHAWISGSESQIETALVEHLVEMSKKTARPASGEEVTLLLSECFDDTDSFDTRAGVLGEFLPRAGRVQDPKTETLFYQET